MSDQIPTEESTVTTTTEQAKTAPENFPQGMMGRTPSSTVNESPRLEGEIRPLDLRTYNGPLYARNLTKTIVSHSTEQEGDLLKLGPRGSDEDISVLPLSVAQHPGFQRFWRQGKVLVTTDPEMEQQLQLAELSQAVRAEQSLADLQNDVQQMDDPAKSDLVGTECLVCKGTTFMTVADIDNRPPLCNEHEHLSSGYISASRYDQKAGETKTVWERPALTPTMKGSTENG